MSPKYIYFFKNDDFCLNWTKATSKRERCRFAENVTVFVQQLLISHYDVKRGHFRNLLKLGSIFRRENDFS
jgi:hypothetical protein